jgi:hypothetical protein
MNERWHLLVADVRAWFHGPAAASAAAGAVNPRANSLALTGGTTLAAAMSSRMDRKEFTMNASFDRLIQLLDSREVRYQSNTENQSICAEFRCDFGTHRIIAGVDDGSSLFVVYGHAMVTVPPGARPAVAETVARANHGLQVGKFEFDLDSGDVRFQCSQIVTDDDLSNEVIDRLIGTTVSMLDLYLPAIMSVIYGNELPKDAIQFVEAGRQSRRESED